MDNEFRDWLDAKLGSHRDEIRSDIGELRRDVSETVADVAVLKNWRLSQERKLTDLDVTVTDLATERSTVKGTGKIVAWSLASIGGLGVLWAGIQKAIAWLGTGVHK